MAVRIYLQATPWAVPVVVLLVLVLAALHVRAVRADPVRGVLSYLYWLAVGGFLAVTVTPNPRAGRARTLSLTPEIPGPRELLSAVDQSGLNAVIAVPLGLTAVLLAVRVRRWWPVVLAVLVPPTAEAVQWAVPSLGRVSFYLGDVTANWTGVVIGAVAGLVLVAFSRSFPRRAASAAPRS